MMEYEYRPPEAAQVPGQVSAPKIREYPPFSASSSEKIAAVFMYLLAYGYARMWVVPQNTGHALLCLFTLGYIALTEYLHRGVPRPRESWVYLGCMAAILLSIVLRRGRAWDDGLPFLFLHIFAVWWVLSRSGTLLEGESGHLLPLDALDGFFIFPFKHFFLRIRCAYSAIGARPGDRKKVSAVTAVWTALALLAAAALLVTSARLLMSADAMFGALLEDAAQLLCWEWDESIVGTIAFSLPAGAYLFGLIAGSAREDREKLRARGAALTKGLEQLQQVPRAVWTALLTVFCALYLVFFFVQGQYLFGAFTRTLPEGFVVAQYARQGFFELCKVMAVNFALLWLATRSSREEGGSDRGVRALCLVLLAQSLLFAVIALSKLALYIDCFGFTPKRLQSSWLVCVLGCGCICAIVSLLHRKKTMRVWMIFGAVTLSLLCLY